MSRLENLQIYSQQQMALPELLDAALAASSGSAFGAWETLNKAAAMAVEMIGRQALERGDGSFLVTDPESFEPF